MNVIVLDGNQRAALSVTRSLGMKGITVSVGEEKQPCLSSSSRYCSSRFIYPSPYTDPGGFIRALKGYLQKFDDVVLIPVTDVTMNEALQNREELGNKIRIPFGNYDSYLSLSDKISLIRSSEELKILFPATCFPKRDASGTDIIGMAGALGYPVVVKPGRSRVFINNTWIKTGVKYARSPEELALLISREPFKSTPFLIQERINGPGIGVFLCMKDGEVLAHFAHRRIREFPPSGGVSVLCESVEPDRNALDSAIKLLRRTLWTGVAMVEFKLDSRDNLPKLIEVNARLWGSLQLAVSSGVDFPYLLYRLACGDYRKSAGPYRIGIKSRWELGDLDHLQVRLRKSNALLMLQPDAPSKTQVLRHYVADCLDARVQNEILRRDDPKPFLHELTEYIRSKAGRLLS